MAPATAASVTEGPIVIVDDSDDDVFMFKRVLGKMGLRNPVVVLDGDAAFAFFHGSPSAAAAAALPLACFLDIKMPGRDGFELLRSIRADRRYDRMAVIVLSSSDERRDLMTARDLGAQCYVRKYASAATIAGCLRDAANHASTAPRSAAWFQFADNLIASR